MSLAAMIRAMAALGKSADEIADIVTRMDDERLEKARAGNARRQAAYRKRHRQVEDAEDSNGGNGVTGVMAVTTVTPPKERPHTPKESSPPLPSPPKGGSVRPPAGGLDDPKSILAEVLPIETAAEVVAHRKALRAPLTAGSAKALGKQLAACGDPLAGAQAMLAGGWRGFKPEWMTDARGARAGPAPRGRTVADLAAMSLHDEPDIFDDPRSDPRHSAAEGTHPADETRRGFAGRLSEPAAHAARRGALIDH